MGERTHFNDESDDSGIGLAVVVLLLLLSLLLCACAVAVALAVAVLQEAATVAAAAAATREMLICVRCSLVGAGLLGVFKRLSRVFQSAEQFAVP